MSEIREIKPQKWKSTRPVRDALTEAIQHARDVKVTGLILLMTDKNGNYTDFVICPGGSFDSVVSGVKRLEYRLMQAWEES
jgi:hypothetical protein